MKIHKHLAQLQRILTTIFPQDLTLLPLMRSHNATSSQYKHNWVMGFNHPIQFSCNFPLLLHMKVEQWKIANWACKRFRGNYSSCTSRSSENIWYIAAAIRPPPPPLPSSSSSRMRNLDDGTDEWKGRPPPDRLRILYKKIAAVVDET